VEPREGGNAARSHVLYAGERSCRNSPQMSSRHGRDLRVLAATSGLTSHQLVKILGLRRPDMPESCVRSTGVRTPRPADDRASSMEARSIGVVEFVRNVVVFDAADLSAESAFWAGMLEGHVFVDEAWHSVVDASGEWRIGVQLSPNHVPPDWPDGSPQQVHLDLHVDDPRAAHDEATALGTLLRAGLRGQPRSRSGRTPSRISTGTSTTGNQLAPAATDRLVAHAA